MLDKRYVRRDYGYADDMWLLSPTQDGLQEMSKYVVITVKISIYRLVPIRIQEEVKQSVLLIQRKRKPCEKLCLMGVNYHGSAMQNIWDTRLVLG